jgi:hypothetical protein
LWFRSGCCRRDQIVDLVANPQSLFEQCERVKRSEEYGRSDRQLVAAIGANSPERLAALLNDPSGLAFGQGEDEQGHHHHVDQTGDALG